MIFRILKSAGIAALLIFGFLLSVYLLSTYTDIVMPILGFAALTLLVYNALYGKN